MHSLLAIQAADGWVYFSDQTGFKLMRPPYGKESVEAIPPSTMESVLARGQVFEPLERSLRFDSLDSLISYIREFFDDSAASMPQGSAKSTAEVSASEQPMTAPRGGGGLKTRKGSRVRSGEAVGLGKQGSGLRAVHQRAGLTKGVA
jgi:hypothetical protein